MNSKSDGIGTRACWFVGAAYGGTNDQTAKFIDEGIWHNGYKDKYLDLVRSMQVGDRIAIKSSYIRKHKLPFDNRGQTVSVMGIKAVGTITENPGDGRTVKVDWTHLPSTREWYFYTHRGTVWRVVPGDWDNDALIAFAFEDKPQDIHRFCNAPFWRERFGDDNKHQFLWTKFYEEVADKILTFRTNRVALADGIQNLKTIGGGLSYLEDQYKDGSKGPLNDICPFTAMGTFNRGVTDANRKSIATELAKFLGVKEPVPNSWEGIPLLNNQRSWFFNYEKQRRPEDIGLLWDVFAEAIRFADSDDGEPRPQFMEAYDKAAQVAGVGWNLTMGLYWARPWKYPTLDTQSQVFIQKKLSMEIGRHGAKGRCNSSDYLTLLDTLEARFKEETYTVHSFPELSLAAYLFKDGAPVDIADPEQGLDDDSKDEIIANTAQVPIVAYTIDNILDEGCFIKREQLTKILERLRTKKNLILQGPPGTGKTWLAKRLAFALIAQRDDSKVRALQFHPNLSYEDFVRGWRPSGEGKLSLADGPFMEIVEVAKKQPEMRHVVVIEEINRGNPAQIFGEMLTLLEVDKRTPDEALELCYRRTAGERVFIPGNLYIIGTMNIADRSIALVDLALRRRFAFVDLEPALGETWRSWVTKKCGIPADILLDIESRVVALNNVILGDASLGRQFRLGHSFVTPPPNVPIEDGKEWFRQVVETEIGPLLDEYWFDAPEKARQSRQTLIAGL